MKKRIEWIDISKAYGIFLIVFGHVITHSNNLSQLYKYIYSFHVPFFFLLSGIVLTNNKNFKTKIANNFKKIVIPYLLFSLLFLIPYYFFGNGVSENLNRDVSFNFIDNIFGIFRGISETIPQNRPLWFLPCLFIVKTIYDLILCKIDLKKIKNFILLELLFIALGIVFQNIEQLPWCINQSIVMLCFYNIGYAFSNKINSIKKVNIVFPIIFLIIGFIFELLNGNINVMNNSYGNYILFFASSIFTITGYILLFNKIKLTKLSKLTNFIGKNTLYILIFHKLIVVVFQTKLGVISKILLNGKYYIQIPLAIVITILSITLSLIIMVIYKKILKKILKVGD